MSWPKNEWPICATSADLERCFMRWLKWFVLWCVLIFLWECKWTGQIHHTVAVHSEIARAVMIENIHTGFWMVTRNSDSNCIHSFIILWTDHCRQMYPLGIHSLAAPATCCQSLLRVVCWHDSRLMFHMSSANSAAATTQLPVVAGSLSPRLLNMGGAYHTF